MSTDGKKTILLNGFKDSELSALVDYIRKSPSVGRDAIFASVTETSREWTVGALLEELEKEHAAFHKKKN